MAKEYNIGKFTESVMFLHPEAVVTQSGARETNFIVGAIRDAEITDYLRQHQQEQSALTEGESYVVTTWTVPNASTAWKVEWRGVQYEIARVVKMSETISRYYIERLDLCEN